MKRKQKKPAEQVQYTPSVDNCCGKCGSSGFQYNGFKRGYVCLICGTIKPERLSQPASERCR